MSDTERAKVAQALDLVRGALAAYVDAAMAKAYGAQWDERVADEEATRRPDGRRQHVSKNDLAVLLKVIQYRRIAPWWDSTTYVDPRIRSFASEILTLRNLLAHGNDCVNEHVRLVDTASRLLRMLDLPVPGGLQPPDQTPTNVPSDGVVVAVPAPSPIATALFDSEVARLGESGERVAQMLRRIQELPGLVYRQGLEDFKVDPGSPVADFVRSELNRTSGNTARKITDVEMLDLIDEIHRLEADADADPDALDSPSLKVLALFARGDFLGGAHGAVGLLALLYAVKERTYAMDEAAALIRLAPEEKLEEREESSARLRAAGHRVSLVEKWMRQGRVERWREIVQLAHRLDDGSPTANSVIIQGNLELLDDQSIDSDEALRLWRDSSARARMLAGMNPGSEYETVVIHSLRREGELCNDLGRPDEAARAFARADEIIDRYPAADPNLVF